MRGRIARWMVDGERVSIRAELGIQPGLEDEREREYC